MIKIFSALVVCIISFTANSQKEFFQSQQTFTGEQLSEFYSSITIENNWLLFIGCDYKMYAYDRQTGDLKWKTPLQYKTDVAPLVIDSIIYTGHYKDRTTSAAQFNLNTGKFIRELPVGTIATKPLVKNDILYGTAIYDGGCLFAYDLKKDTLLWWRFLAHGYSTQPYYFKDYIYANAEADHWVKVGYDGKLIDTTCREKADIFVSDIPCIQNFYALTHDGEKIDGKLASAIFEEGTAWAPEIITTRNNSFVIYEEKLAIIGNKRKVKQVVAIPALADSIETITWNAGRLLKADDEKVSFFYNDHLFTYDHKHKKLARLVDLTQWEPHKVVLDENKLWLISKKDGRLYGLTL